MLAMALSAGHNVTLNQTFNASLPRLPKMFLLILLCSILISAGFMLIIPGIIFISGICTQRQSYWYANNLLVAQYV